MGMIATKGPKKTQVLMKNILTKFKQAESAAWLTKKQLGLTGNRTLEAFASVLLCRLVKSKILEESSNGARYAEKMYRPTHAGWTLLENVEAFPLTELYARFGTKPETKDAGDCRTCGAKIKERKSNATECWACAPTNRRVRCGMDHVPRSEQFIKALSPGRRASELGRVAFAAKTRRKEQRARFTERLGPPAQASAQSIGHSSEVVKFKLPEGAHWEMTEGGLLERLTQLGQQVASLEDVVRRVSGKLDQLLPVARAGNGHDKESIVPDYLLRAIGRALLQENGR